MLERERIPRPKRKRKTITINGKRREIPTGNPRGGASQKGRRRFKPEDLRHIHSPCLVLSETEHKILKQFAKDSKQSMAAIVRALVVKELRRVRYKIHNLPGRKLVRTENEGRPRSKRVFDPGVRYQSVAWISGDVMQELDAVCDSLDCSRQSFMIEAIKDKLGSVGQFSKVRMHSPLNQILGVGPASPSQSAVAQNLGEPHTESRQASGPSVGRAACSQVEPDQDLRSSVESPGLQRQNESNSVDRTMSQENQVVLPELPPTP